MIQTHFNHF